MSELTPMKELFLQQRPPRLLIAGADRLPLAQIVSVVFQGQEDPRTRNLLFEVYRWQTIEVPGSGFIAMLDARGADATSEAAIREELKREAADAVIIITDAAETKTHAKTSATNGAKCTRWNDEVKSECGIISIHLDRPPTYALVKEEEGAAFGRVWGYFDFVTGEGASPANQTTSQRLIHMLVRRLPNACRVELARSVGDRAAQREIAQVLIKSSTAICAAIGAQPIPLADLPVLTSLQLLMVSGIMHLSGREKSLRAATEFVGAIGANVGAGMLMREGARALLKFIPGWGNVVCGMIAGAGTYAVGQSAAAYFLEGVTLGEARRAYLAGKRRRRPKALAEH